MSEFLASDDSRGESIVYLDDKGGCTVMPAERVAELLNLGFAESCELRQCKLDRDRFQEQARSLAEEVERLRAEPNWEIEAKRAFWCGLEIGAGMGSVAIAPRWEEYVAKRKGEISELTEDQPQ